MTNKEMFDKAWNGLKSQGWQKAMEGDHCVYLTSDGKRCAWGWVDPEGTCGETGVVEQLARRGIGLASCLSYNGQCFARSLQYAHDGSNPNRLEQSMRDFAENWGLTIPGGTNED